MNEIVKMIVVLTVISGVCGVGLAGLNEVTKDRIELMIIMNEVKPTLATQLFAVDNKPVYDNDPIKERRKVKVMVEDKKLGKDVEQEFTVFPIKLKGKLFAVAFESYSKGFGGKLGVLVGFSLEEGKEGRIVGIGLTVASETPGVGMRCKEPEFTDKFRNKLFEDVKDIDGLSGATVTSKASKRAVTDAIKVFKKNIEAIKAAFK